MQIGDIMCTISFPGNDVEFEIEVLVHTTQDKDVTTVGN